MKLRIDSRPWAVVALQAAAAIAFWLMAQVPGLFWLALPFALLYSLLFLLGIVALVRIRQLEHWIDPPTPCRLLILAPHEDDCVIAAGGLGHRNAREGGATRILYLARDENAGLPERRAREAKAAWRRAGVTEENLSFLDLLPPLGQRDPTRLRLAARALRDEISSFRPDIIVVPAFEGGHIHHDMVAGMVGALVERREGIEVFEAPEYSPYTSLLGTPHRILALTARWLFGLVSYNGPPDGIGCRPVLKLRLGPDDLKAKRKMLAAFESQNAPSLVATRSYPDRLMRYVPPQRHPFSFEWSYLRLSLLLRRVLPGRLVGRLMPGEPGTMGRTGAITDWEAEWSPDQPAPNASTRSR